MKIGRWILGVSAASVAFSALPAFLMVDGYRGPAPQDDADFPLGALTNEAETPEQISLLLEVTDTLATTVTATVRYREVGAGSWTTGHPLYRIRPSFSQTPAIGTVTDDFAWPIIDLDPGTSYDVEVTVSDGVDQDVITETFATSALPPACGAVTDNVNTSGNLSTAIAALTAGDTLLIADGAYTIQGLQIGVSGTAGSPICIQGESRDGVVLTDLTGRVVELVETNHIVLENLTLVGSGADSGTSATSKGIIQQPNGYNADNVTIRGLVIQDVDTCIIFDEEVTDVRIYNNTCVGNNTPWNAEFTSSVTWNDDGIRAPGLGNAVWNNTLIGFGDSLSLASHSGLDVTASVRAVYFYRNDARNSGDDLVEVDHAQRNVGVYDNRSHNSMTCMSLDPLYGGPLLFARNQCINIGRTVIKYGSSQGGYFALSNTVLMTRREGDNLAAWYAPGGHGQRSLGYQNNLMIWRSQAGQGSPRMINVGDANTGFDPLDWTNNAWYPSTITYVLGEWSGANLTAIQADAGTVEPVFGPATEAFIDDVASATDPFASPCTLGADYLTEVTATCDLTLDTGEAAKNAGIAVAGVTDGFSGAAPDIGALIAGRAAVNYGDQTP